MSYTTEDDGDDGSASNKRTVERRVLCREQLIWNKAAGNKKFLRRGVLFAYVELSFYSVLLHFRL